MISIYVLEPGIRGPCFGQTTGPRATGLSPRRKNKKQKGPRREKRKRKGKLSKRKNIFRRKKSSPRNLANDRKGDIESDISANRLPLLSNELGLPQKNSKRPNRKLKGRRRRKDRRKGNDDLTIELYD